MHVTPHSLPFRNHLSLSHQFVAAKKPRQIRFIRPEFPLKEKLQFYNKRGILVG
jgi:hypothetical protein